jgi:predicted dehydrogenase
MRRLGVAIIGCGEIALATHLPGLKLTPQARLVALCDADKSRLDAAAKQTQIKSTFSDYHEIIKHPDVDAVIISTPNFLHAPIVLAALARKKHVLCEKPLALEYASALEMYYAAEAAGVRHMTAFTYRFVPAMRYMKFLVDSGAIGKPYHFRAQRFQDWASRPIGWRQTREQAGSGELADMLSHRIDYGHLLMGNFRRLVADLRNFVPTRGGMPSDVDDWVGTLAEFQSGASGMLESTKLATGRGEGLDGLDLCEINGSDRTLVCSTQRPMEVLIGRRGAADLDRVPVPREFSVWDHSPRDPRQGDPRVAFRYDQIFEFIDAISSNRPCVPSFWEGVQAQAVMEAMLNSRERRRWVDVVYPTRASEDE